MAFRRDWFDVAWHVVMIAMLFGSLMLVIAALFIVARGGP